MKANSKGSVTPVKKEQKAVDAKRAKTFFLRSALAALYIANAAAGSPNIMTWKKPVMYIPVIPKVPLLDQNLVRSEIPATSNQNTEFKAWCIPKGIKSLFKKAQRPAPKAPKQEISSPRATKPLQIRDHTKQRITTAIKEKQAVTIATQRLPEKKSKNCGSFVEQKRLQLVAAIKPESTPLTSSPC